MTAPIALSIAGSDSSGGAGIQADLKTFSALGVYGASVITAVTAQNTSEVRAVHLIPPEIVISQIEAVLDDLNVDAIKIGMLGSAKLASEVAAVLSRRFQSKIVLDPVMVSKSGAKLLSDDAIDTLRSKLLPLADIVTPNLPEAAVLLGATEEQVIGDIETACRKIVEQGCRSVLLKGGHFGGTASDDHFFDGSCFTVLKGVRCETNNTHGTGCSLSSAIAAELAMGCELVPAVQSAKSYISQAIEFGARQQIGRGHGPVHHFFAYWPR